METTLNKSIENNLVDSFNFPSRVFPVGRLDKESEGLLLLTNNGRIFNKILDGKYPQEKEYIVTVHKPITPEAVKNLMEGICIMGRITHPTKVLQLDTNIFQIILTQGVNRQIRRMCYKLGYEVLSLKRVRIINIHLDQLLSGEWRYLAEEETNTLLKNICLSQ